MPVLTDRQRYLRTMHQLLNGGVRPEVSTQPPDIIVPARNEARTIGPVVKACAESGAVGRVIVVDNASTDETALIARESGATHVVPCSRLGKGQAVTAGLDYVESDRLILLDADLINLTPEHVRMIAKDTSGMVIWVDSVDQIPEIARNNRSGSGTRSMPTSLARSIELVGYYMEGALNYASRAQLMKVEYRDLHDVCQWWTIEFAATGRLPAELQARGLKHYV